MEVVVGRGKDTITTLLEMDEQGEVAFTKGFIDTQAIPDVDVDAIATSLSDILGPVNAVGIVAIDAVAVDDFLVV